MHNTTTPRRLFASFLMILIAVFASRAQALTEYQKGLFSLDIGVGANIGISSLDDVEKTVFDSRPSVATQVSLRPTYYFSRHWGAYADFRTNLFRFNDSEKLLDILMPGISKIKPSFSIGGTYRYEHARWQIQPRLGIGLNSYGGSESNMNFNGNHIHRKLNGDMLCVDAAVSFAYRTSRVCAIYLDVNTMQQITQAKYTRTTTVDDVTTSTVIKSGTWGNTLSISAGIRLHLVN